MRNPPATHSSGLSTGVVNCLGSLEWKLKNKDGGKIGSKEKYHIMDSQKYAKSCKALAWAACNKLNKIWHSNLANEQKVYLFKSKCQ